MPAVQPIHEAPPLPLFARGPLADPVFAGRLLERRLVAEPAVALDHAVGELPDGAEVVVEMPGESVPGRLYRYLTAADYERLDAYSGVGEGLYRRARAEARVGGGAAEPVFLYLPTDRVWRR